MASSADGALYSLKYSSILNIPQEQVDPTLSVILAAALKNNPKHDITGMLYVDRHSKALVQVLEGPKEAVLKLYEIIKADDKHFGLNLLEQNPIVSRVYPEFGMALANAPSASQLAGLASMSDSTEYAQHLVRLQYSSKLLAANVDAARRLLADIVEISVRKNSEKSIGGLLCFNPSTMGVTQVLEGPAAAVRELFTAIMVDSRHTDCRLSKEELLLSEEDYLFGAAWGMMQSETQETGLVDLPSRIWQAYHAQTASAALEQVDDPLGAVPMTPVAAFMM